VSQKEGIPFANKNYFEELPRLSKKIVMGQFKY
jgi:hypothetical protein